MSVYIGKVRSDGTVLLITLLNGRHHDQNVRILKRFYTREHRLDALLELGTLRLLRPSPYGKSSCTGDPVHCRAEHRDEYESKKKNLPFEAGSKEALSRMSDYCFLWENGKWLCLSKNGCVPIDEYDPRKETGTDLLEEFELKELTAKGELNPVTKASIKKWADLQPLADAGTTTYFLYRNQKLIARFEPKTTDQ